ncbi:MAG: endonuclease/exonuclease/phosphatase family protein [Armatimonadota bacterium]
MKKRRNQILLAVYLLVIAIIRFGFGPRSEMNWFTYEMVHNGILFFVPLGILLVLIGLWKRKFLPFAFVILLANWLVFADPILRLPKPRLASHDLRLISYNIAHGWIDIEGVRKVLRDSNADIICLQEAATDPKEIEASAKVLAEKLGYNFWVQESHNAILSRFPVRLENVIDVPTKWPNKKFPEVVISTPKGDVRVISVHFEPSWIAGWPPDLSNWKSVLSKVVNDRRAQAEMVLARVRQSSEPVIVAGDFNGPPYTEIPSRFRSEMTDSFAADGSGCGMTLLPKLPYQRIDFAFVRGLKPMFAEVINSNASDHRPVLFEFNF